MSREKIDAILQELIQEAPLEDLALLAEDNNLRVKSLAEALISELANLSRDSESPAPLMKELREAYPAEDFWDQAEHWLENLLRPYQETAFLRAMSDEALERYMLYTFENMVRYQEPWTYLNQQLGVDGEQLRVTFRVHNTLIRWVVECRYSKRNFVQECRLYFQWPDALSGTLWELLNENHTMLAERTILKSIDKIEQSLDKTSSFLDGFNDIPDFDPDDFEDEDEDSFEDEDFDIDEDPG